MRTLRVAGVYDRVGSLGRKPADELRDDWRHISTMTGVRARKTLCRSVREVPEGTEVLLFDYGGASGGYGHDVLGDELRLLFRWAEDHPSALAVVVSSFCAHFVREELRDERTYEVRDIPNLVMLHDYTPNNGNHDVTLTRIKELAS